MSPATPLPTLAPAVRLRLMRPPFRLLLLSLLLLPASPGRAVAQSDPRAVPKRPQLAAGRDSNSARDYYFYGATELGRHPEQAAAAFYWASRIDPAWADPIYGRFIALLVAQPSIVLTEFITRQPQAHRYAEIRQIDSLGYLALLRNPLVDRRLDGILLEGWLLKQTGGTFAFDQLANANPALAGWINYGQGHFPASLEYYTAAIRRTPRNPELHFERAMPFLALGQLESARREYQAGLAILRDPGEAFGGPIYHSNAMGEYGVGQLFERASQWDSARAAYERALLDQLDFWPAHRQLARLRLGAQDTIGALDEYRQVAVLAPHDAPYLFEFGMLLLTQGKSDSAAVILKRAADAEPWYPQPRLPLALLYERSGYRDEAIEQYTAFIRLAPQTMERQLTAARGRLAALQASASP